jgi:hypothetical protein
MYFLQNKLKYMLVFSMRAYSFKPKQTIYNQNNTQQNQQEDNLRWHR